MNILIHSFCVNPVVNSPSVFFLFWPELVWSANRQCEQKFVCTMKFSTERDYSIYRPVLTYALNLGFCWDKIQVLYRVKGVRELINKSNKKCKDKRTAIRVRGAFGK